MGGIPQFDVFLSHASGDKPAVEVLARRLRSESGLKPFLDKWHLIPGQPWQKELEDSLHQSACTAVFFGPAGGGPWRTEELQLALSRAARTHNDYRVIPVLLPGADPEQVTGFLGLRTWVDFRTGLDDAEAYGRLVAGIRGEPVEVGSYGLPDHPAPYRGLLAFDADHASFFFGRGAEIRRLTEKVGRTPFVAIVGASGSGKSSLALAGLLPALARGALPGSAEWRSIVVRPGGDPLRALADGLAALGLPDGHLARADLLAERLKTREDGLRTAIPALVQEPARRVLLLIDQFEELFTHGYESSRERRDTVMRLVALLGDAASLGGDRLRIVITLRADFVGHCLEVPRLAGLLEDAQILLGALSDESLREAILFPARHVGAFFEKGLVQLILRDVAGQPAALPLLQHALLELWRARRGPWLTLEAYERCEGIAGALHQRAQQTYEALGPAQKEIARHVFLRLVSVGEGVADTRRRAPRDELYPAKFERAAVDGVLAILSGADGRLIVVDSAWVEVAHEALLQRWKTLQGWIDEGRGFLLVHRRLSVRVSEWAAKARDEALCYDELRLTEVRHAWLSLRGTLSALEEQFVLASWHALMRSRRRRIFWGAVLLSAGLAINALLVGMVFTEGPGVAAMHLVPIPLGFGLFGLLSQRHARRAATEYATAVVGALLLEGALLFFFNAIWPSL